MSKHHSHLNTAKTLLLNYNGQKPFAQEIKEFFSTQKKYGSKDRRQIRHLCYCYFRSALAMDRSLSIEEKMLTGYFLCTSTADAFLEELKPEWTPFISLPIEEKCAHVGISVDHLFPKLNHVESAIDQTQFALSHLSQPDLFLRIRPNQTENVIKRLDKAQIAYKLLDDDCIALNNATKIEDTLRLNKEVVIQDYASQRVGGMLDVVKAQTPATKIKLKVWDCCAASGGKSILAFDKLGAIDLTLSDIREGILHNLKMRMQEAQISGYNYKKIDLTNAKSLSNIEDFDLIIADVPCSGSGTWSRTPERLLNFVESEIAQYTKLQKTITENIQTKLKPGAFLLYITCSVYQQENSQIVNNLITNSGLVLIQSENYTGYQFNSDTMYAALLRKPM
jgi:16S rRNA (cytosine967-C5)-methyltransferase